MQFRSGSKVYFFDPGNLTVLPGMEVIVDTAHGQEFGRCHRGNHMVSANQVVQPLRQVIRIATAKDQKINDENRVLETKAFELCRQIEKIGARQRGSEKRIGTEQARHKTRRRAAESPCHGDIVFLADVQTAKRMSASLIQQPCRLIDHILFIGRDR